MSLVRTDESAFFAIEQLDPRTRILSACAIVLGAVAMQSHTGQFAMAMAALGLAAFADLKGRDMLHRLAHVEGFMIVLLVLLPLTMPGRALATFGPLTLSEPGLMRALSIVLKVNAAVLATMALLATLEPVRLGRGLASLGAPSRLIHILLFLVRYQSLFREEGARLMEAMRARGFAPKLDMRTWRAYGNFTGMLLVRSMERAERVEEAMRCRGFSGKFPLRSTRPLQSADYGFMAAVALVVAVLAIWDRLL
jgi:cobalt/nickel transport system permease protein